MRNMTQTKGGDLLDSLEACQRQQRRRHDRLIVGNTGSFTFSFSSVEEAFVLETGYDGTPDHTLTSLVQGRLFGCPHRLRDLNGDGFDEHIITEPLNATGKWLERARFGCLRHPDNRCPVSPVNSIHHHAQHPYRRSRFLRRRRERGRVRRRLHLEQDGFIIEPFGTPPQLRQLWATSDGQLIAEKATQASGPEFQWLQMGTLTATD